MAKLMGYRWPGNARQLENVILRANALGAQEVLALEDLPAEIVQQTGFSEITDGNYNLKAIEKKTIRQALLKAGGNRAEAAKLLGVNTTTVYRKMAKYNLI
jgi:transcriptional regulator of acetoin/glycerol metabolism